MKAAHYLLAALVFLSACRSAKVQTAAPAVTKVDTTPVIVIAGSTSNDSARLVADVYNKVIKNKVDFTTFSAKARLAYSSAEGSDDANAYIRIIKDSAIWLSLRGALGIEGARLLITTDSVKMSLPLQKKIALRNSNYLQQLTGFPVNLYTLQDLIIGNPVFIDSNIISYSLTPDNQLLVLMLGRYFSHLATINNNDYTLIHTKLEERNRLMGRIAEISYMNYDTTPGIPFSTQRQITVSEPTALKLQLDFKQYEFNRAVSLPFKIEEDYTIF